MIYSHISQMCIDKTEIVQRYHISTYMHISYVYQMGKFFGNYFSN